MPLSFICLDLDDTLIHATEDLALVPAANLQERRYGPYRCFLRPSTSSLLRLCRSVCPETILFTASQKQFALGVSTLWNLGFETQHILALEHFFLGQKNISPSAVLIDDKPPSHNDAKLKMAFLGIQPPRYFQVPPFIARDDLLTAQILGQIKSFLAACSR